MQKYDVYKDINIRTGGEIYIGVVGPVRTGKSTFVKRFMDLLVLPNITDENVKARAIDELPQSATGKTIMTTEPKFVPSKAVDVQIDDKTNVKLRLIDCVGFLVNGATGHIEAEHERMVKTPWFEYDIPFTNAAEIGTNKVIKEHSTIGIVVTTDGTIGEIPRENYIEAEAKTINELKQIGKPFVVLINSSKPYSEESRLLAEQISDTYGITALPINAAQIKLEDITMILGKVLDSFPVSKVCFFVPKWVEMLDKKHWLKSEIIDLAKNILKNIRYMMDIDFTEMSVMGEHVKRVILANKDMATGIADINFEVDDEYYYEIISDLTNNKILNEYDLVHTLREFKTLKDEYSKVKDAMNLVEMKGYGVVVPSKKEITLENPEIIRDGNKFGIKIKAKAPSIHMIKADVLTEIAPIVGSEEQANDLLSFIKLNDNDTEGIWNTNIFGKTIEQIVFDGITMKINRLTDETQSKMQDTIEKITNESKGGVICIIL